MERKLHCVYLYFVHLLSLALDFAPLKLKIKLTVKTARAGFYRQWGLEKRRGGRANGGCRSGAKDTMSYF